MSLLIEEELRTLYADKAATVPATTDPVGRTVAAIGRARARRVASASAVAVVLLAGASTGLHAAVQSHPNRVTNLIDPDPTPTPDPAPTPSAPHATLERLPWTQWPTRGSLGPDKAFMSDAISALAKFGVDTAADMRALYGGDVADRRLLVALVRDGNHQLLVELSGPGGTDAASLDTFDKAPVAEVAPPLVAFARQSGSGVDLTLLADPRVDRVEISDRLDYGGGPATREWRPVDLSDGLTSAHLQNSSVADLRLRAYSAGELVFEGTRSESAEPEAHLWQVLVEGPLHGTAFQPDGQDIARQISIVAEIAGVQASGLTAELVWSGDVFPGKAKPQAAVVFVLRHPHGWAWQVVVDRWDGWIGHRFTPVPWDTAERLPAIWLTNPQDLGGCTAAIAVPAGGLSLRVAEFSVGGKSLGLSALAPGTVATLDRCSAEPGLDLTPGVMRLKDPSGKVLAEWTEKDGIAVVTPG